MEPQENEEISPHLRKIMGWTIVVVGGAFVVWFGYVIFFGLLKDVVPEMARQHYQSVVGLPCSGIAALFIVLLLRNVAGPIQFKALGFEFKGASGPIIMWILCFLAMVVGIVKTWKL